MFLYICQALPHFQFTEKLNNWNSERSIWWFVVACWWFVVVYWWFAVAVVCWWFVVVCW